MIMKKIENVMTSMTESQAKYGGNKEVKLTYVDLMEMCLDIVPQGGFTPKDIRERNRIQVSIDEYKKKVNELPVGNTDRIKGLFIELEDSDYKAFVQIVKASRWTIRDRDLQDFLSLFDKDE